jgi:hypothetical protein
MVVVVIEVAVVGGHNKVEMDIDVLIEVVEANKLTSKR